MVVLLFLVRILFCDPVLKPNRPSRLGYLKTLLYPSKYFRNVLWEICHKSVSLPLISKKEARHMYAIVEIAGQQFKVEKGRTIFTHRLEGDVDAALVFDKVLLVDDGGAIQIGAPGIEGITVNATILEHLKGEKVIVFKKKRRKGYRKKNGHRQYLTKIRIDDILV
jgi:large subunit ribosomal protein L21